MSFGPDWKKTCLELKTLGQNMRMEGTVPMRESDSERKSDAQVNKILSTTSIFGENLSVLT